MSPRKTTQRCSEPDCGQPAAFSTRTNPTWCDAHITKMLCQGGLEPLGSVFKDHRVVDHGGVIRRHELTDQEWELLAPLIPRATTGRPRVSDRQVINGMVYKIRTGISWRDLPERYGPWQTVYTRFRRYALDGVFTRALQQIQAHADAADDIDWLVQIDSTIVRAHQHAAATGRKGGSTGRTNRTITPSADPEAD